MLHSSRLAEWCRRLSKMGWDELRVRAVQEAAKGWDAVTRVGASYRDEPYDPSVRSLGRFFFTDQDVPALSKVLRERHPETVGRILTQAEEICRHRFDLLGYRHLDYGKEIDWHLDPVHGRRAPDRPWFLTHYLDFDQVGDAKIIWELSRHQHLVTLAKAYRLSGESRYLAELVRQWYGWQEQNPYGVGINWASSLEVAFRSLSWIWILQLLTGEEAVPLAFPVDVQRALLMNARHIERFLSTYFSPNTHLLGEGVGLYFIGTLVDGSSRARLWRDKGWKIVLEEAARQVQSDGMHFEQSIYYHVYALDFFLHARILAGINALSIPPAFDETVMKMLTALASLAKPGPLPNFGDDDGGRVFDAQRNQREHLTDPLSVGAALFNNPKWKNCAGEISEETIWLLGVDGVKRFTALEVLSMQPRSSALVSSGIYAMRGSKTDSQLVIDAGPQSAGRHGHGHADALGIQLAVNGRMLLVDPGTASYMDGKGEREKFRATAAHNTIEVDGLSQAAPAGPFGWRDLPAVNADRWLVGESFDLFTGSHHGYTRLSDPVVHRRHIFHLRDEFWVVRDVLTGEERHEFQSSWHFAPGELSTIPGGAQYVHPDGTGMFALSASQKNLQQRIIQDSFSPVYGQKIPSPVLQLSGQQRLPTEFALLLLPRTSLITAPGFFNMAEDSVSGKAIRAYIYSTAQEESHLVFCDESGKWEAGPWSSDAAFLFCRINAYEHLSQLVLCEGSYLDFRGQRIFASSTSVARAEWYQTDQNPRFCCSSEAAVCVRPVDAPRVADPAFVANC